MSFIRAKDWNGKALIGEWYATLKLDGVRVLRRKDGKLVSRKNKPLYNMDHLARYITDCEVYCGSLKATIQCVRASKQDRPVLREQLFTLDPPDKRLRFGRLLNPTAEDIRWFLWQAMNLGAEGLVLRQGDKWIKIKRHTTYDVRVTGYKPGTGKYRGKVGALLTARGRVGGGLKDFQREISYYRKHYKGKIIEVKCQQFTPDKKFRHARLVRVRDDK